jgi:cytochrome P450
MRDAARLGDLVEVQFPSWFPRIFFASHPDTVEAVLLHEHGAFRKDVGTRLLGRLTGQGLIVSDGAFWRRQRGLAQPAFHHKRVVGYAATMARLARTRALSWGEDIDVNREWMALTLEVVAETLFGAQVSSETASIAHALDGVMEYFVGFAGTGWPLPLSVPTPVNLRFRAGVKTIDAMVYRFLAERRAEGEAAVSQRADLLSMLLAARDEDGQAMSEQQLRDEAVTLVLAGHETTALALAWATWLLGQHPDAARRAAAEVRAALGTRDATFEDLSKLRFVDAIIHESMRLYPPAWIIGREALESVTIAGVEIPKGAQVYTSSWLVHRDARFFQEPEAFRPERWEHELAKQLPRFAYFPFGGGPRICIGNAFARMEAVILLATVLQHVRLEVLTRDEPGLVPSITLRPARPIRARVWPL